MKKLIYVMYIFVATMHGAAFNDVDEVQHLVNALSISKPSISELMAAEGVASKAQEFWNNVQWHNGYTRLKLQADAAVKHKKSPITVRVEKWRALEICVNKLLHKAVTTEKVPLIASEKELSFIGQQIEVTETLSDDQEKIFNAGKLAWIYYQQECFARDPQAWHARNQLNGTEEPHRVPEISDLVCDVLRASIGQGLSKLSSEQVASPLGQFFATFDCRALVARPEVRLRAQQYRKDISILALLMKFSAVRGSYSRQGKAVCPKPRRAFYWQSYYGLYAQFLGKRMQKDVPEQQISPNIEEFVAAYADQQPSQELLDVLSAGYVALALDMQQQQYNRDPQSLRTALKEMSSKRAELHELPFRLIVPKAGRCFLLTERLKEQIQQVPFDVQESPIGSFYHSFLESESLQGLCNDKEIARIALRYFIAGQRNDKVQGARLQNDIGLNKFVSRCIDAALPEMQNDLPEIKFGNSLKFMINENRETPLDERAKMYLKAGLLSMAMAANSGSTEMRAQDARKQWLSRAVIECMPS